MARKRVVQDHVARAHVFGSRALPPLPTSEPAQRAVVEAAWPDEVHAPNSGRRRKLATRPGRSPHRLRLGIEAFPSPIIAPRSGRPPLMISSGSTPNKRKSRFHSTHLASFPPSSDPTCGAIPYRESPG